jgi:hypothetical protein
VVDWHDEIKARIEDLPPEARALFSEIWRGMEEFDFMVPPDELVLNLRERVSELSAEDRAEYMDLWRVIARRARAEADRNREEAEQADLFIRLIRRAQELDRRAGRPVNECMTIGEALARLKEAGEEEEEYGHER